MLNIFEIMKPFFETKIIFKMTNLKTNVLAIIGLLTFTLISINTNAQLYVAKENVAAAVDAGSVGIGTDTPTEKLDVNGNINVSGGFLKIGSNSKGTSAIDVGKNRTKNGVAFIDLFPSPDRAGRFISAFNNGKASTSFHNNGEGDFTIRVWGKESRIRFTTDDGIDHTDEIKRGINRIIILPNSGNVGINTPTPTAKLEVDGDVKKPGGGEWDSTSDKRTKKNVNRYEAGLEDVLKLNPVTFNYNGKAGISDTEKTHVGLIAQEFAEIAPYAIDKFTYTEKGNSKTEEYLSLNASSVKYMLVNAVKEQQALIEAQKAKIESLEEKMEKLVTNSATIATPGASEISVILEGSGTEKALLAQNTPNPFTASTRIEYFIPTNSRHCRFLLKIWHPVFTLMCCM